MSTRTLRTAAIHVPLGWVSLLTGVLGAVLYIVSKIRGIDTDFTLFAASLAAFVAGWVACVSIPQLNRRIRGAEQAPPGEPSGGASVSHSEG